MGHLKDGSVIVFTLALVLSEMKLKTLWLDFEMDKVETS